MREFTETEISQISDGSVDQFAAEGGGYGSILGAMVTNSISGAIRGGAFGAVLGASYGLGYAVGTWAYEHLS